jgi:predicted HicB family RNase H-like nuclease
MAGTRTGNEKPLQVYVSPQIHAALERMAQAQNTTISELVRRNLRDLVTATPQAPGTNQTPAAAVA